MLAVPKQPSDSMDNLNGLPSNLRLLDGASPYQYAIPVQREGQKHGRQQSSGLSYVEHELLRQRKTPNGRLLEHDNSILDKNVQIPASKHLLLSSTPSFQGARLNSDPNEPHNFRQQNYGGNHVNTGFKYGDSVQKHLIADPVLNRPAWDFPGGLDSILNQTLPLQPSQRYYLQYGSPIPTVLPSALQSYFGPTASASQEFYGPYWPDGTFNPYRPASIRDSRFFGRGPTIQNTVRSPIDQVYNVPVLRKPGKLPTSFSESFQANAQHYNRSGLAPFVNTEQFHGTRIRDPYLESVTRREPVPNRHQNDGRGAPLVHQRTSQDPTVSWLRPGVESEQITFRDKTFTWANRVYTEFLNSIQSSNNKDQSGTQTSNSLLRQSPKPAIFPRPPKRSSSHFTETSTTQNTPDLYRQPRPWLSSTNSDEPSRPSTAIYSPRRRASDQPHDFSKLGNHSNTSLQYTAISHDKYDGRRISDSSIYNAFPIFNGQGTYDAAVSALSTMELLCEQAKSPWVDGMLLAGCLAYGLANYMKAMHWYQAVLAQDQSHVEAMSNLAATLHALGRRDEALNYWSAAVRLRPGYFEAVEHLIGLLCAGRRGREAVNIIEFVENSLKTNKDDASNKWVEGQSDVDSESRSRTSSVATMSSSENPHYDYDSEYNPTTNVFPHDQQAPGFGTSGYAIPGTDNGRMLALIHAKGNMLYALGNNNGAASAFEDAILIATGNRRQGIRGLIREVLFACLRGTSDSFDTRSKLEGKDPILLYPDQAELTAKRMFPPYGELPGLEFVAKGISQKAAVSTTSNSLLSLAKIYQDGVSNATNTGSLKSTSTRDILALYYLSLSLQRSPSTANNVGILLAGVQQSVHVSPSRDATNSQLLSIPGVTPGTGISLAFSYYNYGLVLDPKHAHLFTNLGSLLKDIGQLDAAIRMYEMAVSWDGNFDIALANLANAVKDQGRVGEAISYYRRAVNANKDFAEAVCGLATALNSVCNWHGRGGVYADKGRRDRIHVDEHGKMHEAGRPYGWAYRVIEIVEKQLRDGESWGCGVLTPQVSFNLCQQLLLHRSQDRSSLEDSLRYALDKWAGKKWEGSRVVRLVERAVRQIGWQWYQDRYKERKEYPIRKYTRPLLPASLPSPAAPTVLPFHTFTAPLSAKQIRQISQRNALRISLSTLRAPWLPATVYPPPRPPSPCLVVGYVSSDFNNHPLAHLMQSVFGLHDPSRVHAICYATTPSDNSVHRQQIEREAPVFYDVSSWSVERLVGQIVQDRVHVLVNLNGYTRGARNEVFAARPAPIQMSFMGFAGTLGAEWCDYVFADELSVPLETLAPWRRHVDIEDRLQPDALVEDEEDWVYSENVIFARDTFFCVDHRQSAPDAETGRPRGMHDPQIREELWGKEQERRWKLRKETFPTLSDSAVILGNFNQLYKIDPTTFRMYLRILGEVPNAILWLLRFPVLGEQNLKAYALEWANAEVASRIIFTDVAPKGQHITRASVVDLFLDTPECNAHTTAADVVWSGTPIITWAKWKYKMCSRMAGSIVASALPEDHTGDEARRDLLVKSEEEYEEKAIALARGLRYQMTTTTTASSSLQDYHRQYQQQQQQQHQHPTQSQHRPPQRSGRGRGRLTDLRRMLWEGRWDSRLFDTKRWVRDVERAYWEAWRRWEDGEGGDIWL